MTAASVDMVAIVMEYFRRADGGRPTILDLFAEDFEFYFPKFGVGRGRADFATLGQGLPKAMSRIVHDTDSFRIIAAENRLVVEGTSKGTTANGIDWVGGRTPGGRFCSVFDFDQDGLISRMFIYLDPDYGSEDRGRFHWGRDGRKW